MCYFSSGLVDENNQKETREQEKLACMVKGKRFLDRANAIRGGDKTRAANLMRVSHTDQKRSATVLMSVLYDAIKSTKMNRGIADWLARNDCINDLYYAVIASAVVESCNIANAKYHDRSRSIMKALGFMEPYARNRVIGYFERDYDTKSSKDRDSLHRVKNSPWYRKIVEIFSEVIEENF